MKIHFLSVAQANICIAKHIRSVAIFLCVLFIVLQPWQITAQLMQPKQKYTKADSLRGTINSNRDWWNVIHYDITVKPNIIRKEIEGVVTITNQAVKQGSKIQLDLQQPLIVDSIFMKGNNLATIKTAKVVSKKVRFTHQDDIILITLDKPKQKSEKFSIEVYYHGKPKEAVTPPWDGGWIWKKDKNNNPFVSVAVQGLGASAWYPCKDHQSDEPDKGASISVIVPDTLIAVANGKQFYPPKLVTNEVLKETKSNHKKYTWFVKNPINNYCIVPYIGKYVNFSDTLMGEKGKLELDYWVLDYNMEKAKKQFSQVKPMLRAFEYWFGPYPFYEDGYKIVEAPHLGMEHQSAIAYGNQYKNGYLGSDRSGKGGWGLKWDFIIVHESGHEWFANNITTKDIADMWVHESFTTYSETLFTEYYYGKNAANEYNFGQRINIRNDKAIIGDYGVNKEGSGDMYDKGSNMLHSIRNAIKNDSLFRKMLRKINQQFYHQTVTTQQIEAFICSELQFNFQPVFNQYLRNKTIPTLVFQVKADTQELTYYYKNCIPDFNLPIWLTEKIKLLPTIKPTTIKLAEMYNIKELLNNINKLYYVNIEQQL
jgi:aminopeptidase N